jgi:hypothetical protein
MSWTVRFGDEFEQEFQMFPLAVMEALLAVARPVGGLWPPACAPSEQYPLLP